MQTSPTELNKTLFNYKLLIAYDGTNYSGWQIQPNASSIQEIIRKTICQILQEEIRLIGAGRTDAGVHANGQCAHFQSTKQLTLRSFLASMNGLLPKDIRILEIQNVPIDFHAQYSAIGKIYHYHLWMEPILLPTQRLYTLHLKKKIDLKTLSKTLPLFVGEKDFSTFANSASEGSASRGAIRNLMRLEMHHQEGGVRLEFEGNGFLYKMVRNIVGTLLEVASGERSMDEIPHLFLAKDRKKAGKTVPPHGLFLMKVNY